MVNRWPHIFLSVLFALWLPVSQTLALVPPSASPPSLSPVPGVSESERSGLPADPKHSNLVNMAVVVVVTASEHHFDLLTGEQYDPDLGFYYLRARYSNPDSRRFWTMDSYEGSESDPFSLHKYLYAHANPVNGIDPSGHSLVDILNSVSAWGSMAAVNFAAASGGVAGAEAALMYASLTYATAYAAAGVVGVVHEAFWNLVPGDKLLRRLRLDANKLKGAGTWLTHLLKKMLVQTFPGSFLQGRMKV